MGGLQFTLRIIDGRLSHRRRNTKCWRLQVTILERDMESMPLFHNSVTVPFEGPGGEQPEGRVSVDVVVHVWLDQ